MVRPDGEEVTFEYDALGRRLSKSFGATITRWMWNGNVPLHQWIQHRTYSWNDSNWEMKREHSGRLLWLFDERSFVPVAMIKEGRAYSIMTDHLGTPTQAYDPEGNEVWSRMLDMDGNVLEEAGNIGMIPFLFQGQYFDRETGLAYNRFRYYSPQMGIYISQDPIRLEGGVTNIYAYVNDTNVWNDIFALAGSGGAYMFGFESGEMYIGKGEINRMKKSIITRSKQVQNPKLIGAAHVSTHGNNELGKMVEYKAMRDAGFEHGSIPPNYLNTYLSGETAWNANPSLRTEATQLANKLKADFNADVERRRNIYKK